MQVPSLLKGEEDEVNLSGVDGANDAVAGEPMDMDEREGDTVDTVTKTVDAPLPDKTRPDTDEVDGLLPNVSQALGSFLM